MMMSIGLFVFSLPTIVYQDLQHKMGAKFAIADRVGARDAVQYIGPGAETITLSGSTADGINDPETSFDQLVGMMESGQGWPLVDGLGRVYGDFIIEQLDRKKTIFDSNGQPKKTEFGIDLRRVDDGATSSPTGSIANGLLGLWV
jgi:uncharacterized protein